VAASPPRDEHAKACRTAQAIGVALLVSLGIYAVVIDQIQRTHAPFNGFVPGAPRDLLRAIFAALALANLGIVGVIQRSILANAALPLVGRLQSAAIVALALCEAVAIYGLVLFMLGGRAIDYYIFAALALVGFALYFPRQEAWQERAGRTAREDAAKRAPTPSRT
jgi:F0F1-type ATP synthase membrane subunit c/vacuolar-type H+-ATPase subunit K